MVELSNPSRSPSPRPHCSHSSAIVAGRFVVSDASSDETLPTASSSPTKLTSSSSKRRIAGRFIVADEDTVLPNQLNQQSRFEILDLPVVPEGRECSGEPLSSILKNLIDRVSAVERENELLKTENAALREGLARMQVPIELVRDHSTVAKDLSDILLFS